MPWPRKYSDQEIANIKTWRKAGFSYKEIAVMSGMPMSTVIFHTREIKPRVDGRSPQLVKIKDLAAWLQPGVPFRELPLPSGIIAILKEASGKHRRRKVKDADEY
ncbi:hypothetical protein ACFLVX_04605 [Chloroflexota bacterium]